MCFHRRSDELLQNIMPAVVADELKREGREPDDELRERLGAYAEVSARVGLGIAMAVTLLIGTGERWLAGAGNGAKDEFGDQHRLVHRPDRTRRRGAPGPAVNEAARMEPLCRGLGCTVLVSQAFYDACAADGTCTLSRAVDDDALDRGLQPGGLQPRLQRVGLGQRPGEAVEDDSLRGRELAPGRGREVSANLSRLGAVAEGWVRREPAGSNRSFVRYLVAVSESGIPPEDEPVTPPPEAVGAT